MKKTVLLVTMRDLTDQKVYADTLRLLKVREMLQRLGYRVVTVSRNNRLKFEASADGYRLPAAGSVYLAAVCLLLGARHYLRQIVRSEQASAVFINNWLFAPALPLSDVAVHVDVMGLEYREKVLGRQTVGSWLSRGIGAMERRLLTRATIITTVNQAHARVIKALTGRKATVLRDAVEAATIKPVSTRNRRGLIFVGSLSNKRLDELFSALEHLRSEGLAVPVRIIGDGPDRARYEQWASRSALKSVKFLGYLPHREIPGHLQRAAYGYSDDWSEIGFPVKVFEYMAAGTVTLCQDTPAVREVVTPGLTGLLYRSPTELRAIIRQIAKGEINTGQVAAAASKAVVAHTWTKRQEELATIYRREIGR